MEEEALLVVNRQIRLNSIIILYGIKEKRSIQKETVTMIHLNLPLLLMCSRSGKGVRGVHFSRRLTHAYCLQIINFWCVNFI